MKTILRQSLINNKWTFEIYWPNGCIVAKSAKEYKIMGLAQDALDKFILLMKDEKPYFQKLTKDEQ